MVFGGFLIIRWSSFFNKLVYIFNLRVFIGYFFLDGIGIGVGVDGFLWWLSWWFDWFLGGGG